MKKSLLALAVLASIAGVASAQSSVTIYGLVDAGVTHERGGSAGNVTKLSTGVQSGNRLGFKGTEDLGGGLKANFQFENGFNLDEGTQRQGALFGRQAWVGLSGAFGAVNLGRQYNPLFASLDTIDPFGTGLSGATTNLMNPGLVRVNNAVSYSSPTVSGFGATVLYGAGENASGNKVNAKAGAALNYANGPAVVTLAWDKVNADPTAAGSQASELVLLGGTWDFGRVKAHAGYETEEFNGGATGKYRDIMIGVSVPVGAGNIMASYIDKNDRRTASNKGGKQIALGYTHSLSKRTNLYSSVARIENDSNGKNFVGDASSGGSAPSAGQNSHAVSVGVRHKF
jgi:predicted porin